MWHACCKRSGGHAKLEPPPWELLQLCFWAVKSNGRAWETMNSLCSKEKMGKVIVAVADKWGSFCYFLYDWRLITCQTVTECHSCLPVIFNLGATFGWIQQKTTQQFIWVAWHCRMLTLWFMMVIRRYNQWNKNALDASSPSKASGSNASAQIETIKASAECV